MAVTPVGNPYVESSDLVANYPGASEALAERIDIVGVNPFADAAARDAAIPSPVQGQMCSLNDDNKGYRYDGSEWILFSGAGPGNFTNTATGTYTDAGIDYKYLTLTGTGSVTIDQAGLADILIVGGGGRTRTGEVVSYRSGGGAGGLIYLPNFNLTVGTFTISIGAGGGAGVNGGDSNGFNITALGGGYGEASGGPISGYDGGSGSGASGSGAGAVGLGLFSQGNNGGYLASGPAAGGGAGGAGSGSTAGVGLSNSITGSAVTYATGGSSATANTANTGNAGGTGSGSVNGNSGVFIIRVVV